MKLVKVVAGVYRSECGSVRVFYRSWQDKEMPWVLTWTSGIFGDSKTKRFRTLADVRNELKESK